MMFSKMAEFCCECYKRVLKGTEKEYELEMSREPDFCAGCSQWKPVVIAKLDPFTAFMNGLFFGRRKKK